MTAPYVAYTATAGQDEFVVPFPYINRSHVVVKVNGIVREIAAWPSPTILKVAPAVAGGGFVEIYRTTPLDGPLVAFQNGAVLTAEDLNTAVLQLLYRMQESANLYERTVGAATQRLAQLGGVAVPSADVFDTLAQQLLESTLFNELLDRIEQIEQGGGSALLQQEIADRIAAINAVYADIDAEIAALAATQDDKFALVNSRIATVEGVNSAQATQLNTVIAQANSNQAAIAAEATARANADSATASLISLIGAKNAAGTAFIIDANTAQISPGTSLSSRLTGLQSSISSNTAAITSEATTRASADSALSTRIDSVQATANNAAAAVTTEQNARIAGDNALANSISTLTTTVNNNAAAISSEASTRASADSAMAGQINALTTSVNGNTASITSLQGSINGIYAEYGVRLNVNGHITGFRQFNNGTQGNFVVQADVFQIVAPNGTGLATPFTVTADGVRINGNLIVNGTIISNQFNMDTMVRRGNLSWSGSSAPSPGQLVAVTEVALGDIGKNGSILIDYQVEATAYIGQTYSSIGGYPLTTTYMADGYIRVAVVNGAGTILADVTLNGSQYGTSGASTYSVGGFGQKVVELTSSGHTGVKLIVQVYRGSTDTGNVFQGDYYTRDISATYNLTSVTAKAKWTFI